MWGSVPVLLCICLLLQLYLLCQGLATGLIPTSTLHVKAFLKVCNYLKCTYGAKCDYRDRKHVLNLPAMLHSGKSCLFNQTDSQEEEEEKQLIVKAEVLEW